MNTPRLRAGDGSLPVLLLIAACRPAPAAVAAPRAPASAPAASAPATSQAHENGATPNRLGVPGSTRGTVACGSARCVVPGETCVLRAANERARAPSWQCMASDHELDGEQRYACDDASDCSEGRACCLGFESAFVAYACSARSGARANCALESCVADGGAPCPAGQVCSTGACVPADARATCSGGQRCPASAPICVWTKGVASCSVEVSGIEASDGSSSEVRMSCASNQDCGDGLHCCSNALGRATSCRVSCDLANNLQLCRADADCPSGTSQQLRCLPESDPRQFPAWVRVCRER